MVKLSAHRLDMQDARIDQAELRDFSFSKNAPAISVGVLALDISTGNVFEVALNADITSITISNPSPTGKACKFDLIFTADGTARTVTWPASVQWADGGTAPSLTSANGRKDILTFYSSDAGTNWYGKLFMASAGAVGGSVVSATTLVRSTRTGNTILGASDKSTLIDITSGTFTQTFTAAATLGSGWFCYIKNSGTGDVTLDPNASETIDGLTSYVMYPGESRLVLCDGSGFTTIVQSPFSRTILSTLNPFYTPPGYSTFSGLLWGGGGGGGKYGSADITVGGGGGGACVPFFLTSTQMGVSQIITIGSGGSASIGGAGGVGGTSSVGSLVSAYGGGGGGASSTNSYAGGGGGVMSAGASGSVSGGGIGGGPSISASNLTNGVGLSGANGMTTTTDTTHSEWGGAGGGTNGAGTSRGPGNSVYGGAGGAGCSSLGEGGSGGTSKFGGNGGGAQVPVQVLMVPFREEAEGQPRRGQPLVLAVPVSVPFGGLRNYFLASVAKNGIFKTCLLQNKKQFPLLMF